MDRSIDVLGFQQTERRCGRHPRGGHARIEPAHHAGTAIALLGVPDLELYTAAGRPVPVLGNGHRCALSNHVAPNPDPAVALELEPDAGHLGERATERAREAGRLQHEETRADPPRMRRETPQEPLARGRQTRRQIDDEQVDRAPRQQGPGEAQPLNRIRRPEDDEPAQVDPARSRLERVEGVREVEPGNDRAGGLDLGNGAQR